jgi:Flp pilus assembly protein TadD
MAARTSWPCLCVLLLASCAAKPEPRNPGPRPNWNPAVEIRTAMTNGNAGLQSGKFADAVKWFTLAVSIDPANAGARVGRGRALLGMKNFERARTELEGAAESDPADFQAFGFLGEMYMVTEEGARAIEVLTKAIARKADSAWLFRLRAQAHGAVGDMDGAREDAQKAKELGG